MTFRWAQQIRLWIYLAVEGLIIFHAFSVRLTATEFAAFTLVGLLFFLEICPVCGRLAWWETNRWPSTLWISPRCKGHPRKEQ